MWHRKMLTTRTCIRTEYTMVPSVYRKISVSCSPVHMLFPSHYTIHRQCRKMPTICIVHTMVSLIVVAIIQSTFRSMLMLPGPHSAQQTQMQKHKCNSVLLTIYNSCTRLPVTNPTLHSKIGRKRGNVLNIVSLRQLRNKTSIILPPIN
jgi:hypothetical protein